MTPGMVWRVAGRTFRSSVPREREQFEFLVMWTRLEDRERDAYELYAGLQPAEADGPLPLRRIAELLDESEDTIRELVRSATRKIDRYLRYNGLPIRYGPVGSTREALERLRRARSVQGGAA